MQGKIEGPGETYGSAGDIFYSPIVLASEVSVLFEGTYLSLFGVVRGGT